MKVCLPLLIGLILIGIAGCRQRVVHSAAEVEAAMGHYDSLIKKTDADSIAWIYTSDGWLGGVAHGRDSIRRFLQTFKNVRVLEVGSTTKNIMLTGDTARQAGGYTQTALINGKDTVHVRGTYEAEWVWRGKEGWKIRRMTTHAE
jgi:ketosteroid isomerase-like protein